MLQMISPFSLARVYTTRSRCFFSFTAFTLLHFGTGVVKGNRVFAFTSKSPNFSHLCIG